MGGFPIHIGSKSFADKIYKCTGALDDVGSEGCGLLFTIKVESLGRDNRSLQVFKS